ncbi:hypothetical protein H6P81_015808 [Aristolochia fimbriata]|uniref:Glabrous enhancer-binding protein-like DBD domain-containing protein n=1 Tax=Aristolochia fimbriata TaxID=158543 RepID=A0AAV7EB57_ARIFI|nr:hypothetical protein H6P81_015808 [Aristolochia fimbriata]
MAAKRRAAPPPPPSESEPSGSGSEESSEDEATESPPPPPAQTKSPAKRAEVSASKPQLKPRPEESSEGEGSEDEGSEDEATPAAKPVKELAPDESAKSGSESDHEAAAKASGKAAGAKSDAATRKRGAAVSVETADAKPAKRVRASNFVPGKSKEDDEIAILRGLSNYMGKGSDQSIDATALYEFVKGSLNHHEDPQQVADTIRRLKRRYQTIQSNAKRGKSAVPNEGNKKTIHDLSKMIWSQRNAVKISPERKKSKKRQMSSRKVLEFERDEETERPEQKSTEYLVNGHPRKNFLFSCWKELESDNTAGLKLLKEGLELMEPSLARMLEERWKKIEVAKLEILQKQRDLLQEQMEMVVDVLKQRRK